LGTAFASWFLMSDACNPAERNQIMLSNEMFEAVAVMPPLAAAGWAFLYWIFGGGFFGAIILFVVLKMLGK
jgi:hypothetical protein